MLWNHLRNETKLSESISFILIVVNFLYDLCKIVLVLVVKIAIAAI